MINLARYLVKAQQVEALQNAIRGAPWMRFAYEELGVVEDRSGTAHNPRVLEYLQTATSEKPDLEMNDETSWCSGFANWCMTRAGLQGTGNPLARSWLSWGSHISIKTPIFGSVAVVPRGTYAWQGHVGFVIGEDDSNFVILAGNQKKVGGTATTPDSVCIKPFGKAEILGLRWPTPHPIAGACRRFVAHRVHS